MKHQLGGDEDQEPDNDASPAKPQSADEDRASNQDETDTQKLEYDMGLANELGSEKKPKSEYEMDQDEPESMVEELISKEEVELDEMISEHKQPKKDEPKIDVFNDPLLPDDMLDNRRGSDKKRGRSGSFGGGDDPRGDFESDEEDDIAFEDLAPDEKYQVLQHLYEEYQRDPDNFPEDQRILLEQELKELFDQEEQEEEELDNEDPRMKIEGNINFPDELPGRKDDEPKALELDEPDDDEYMQELMNQQKDQ